MQDGINLLRHFSKPGVKFKQQQICFYFLKFKQNFLEKISKIANETFFLKKDFMNVDCVYFIF